MVAMFWAGVAVGLFFGIPGGMAVMACLMVSKEAGHDAAVPYESSTLGPDVRVEWEPVHVDAQAGDHDGSAGAVR